jgi:hypothetical protein
MGSVSNDTRTVLEVNLIAGAVAPPFTLCNDTSSHSIGGKDNITHFYLT